jgi:hypothetical protein
MNIFEDTNPRRLNELLTLVHAGDMALPDFQRSFIWDPISTQDLIISVASNYPAGSLLRVKSSNIVVAVREFESAPPLNRHKPTYLILDGQQRLTSLYQAFYGRGDHRYFINMRSLLDGNDFEESIFHMRSSKADKKYKSIEQQATEMILPLEIVYGDSRGFYGWVDDILTQQNLTKDGDRNVREQIRKTYRNWIEPIEHYEFPVITLSEKTTADALCNIFETLNRTGVKLSVFELLTARFWPEKVNLRSLYDDAIKKYPSINDFNIDPYYVLQSISLLTPGKAPSCKRKDLLKELNAKVINKYWESAISGFDNILKIISEECGVLTSQWLPYNTILIPMAAVWAKQMDATGVKIGSNRKKIIQWFWCSVFSQAYENAPNSQAAKDFVELYKWMEGGLEPETVKNFSFDIDQLRETTPRQRAIYKGIICLILSNMPIDFYEGKPITAKLIKDKKIDDHHIYPDAYLESRGVSEKKRNCIINRTLIDKKTNQRIGKRPPSEYLGEVQSRIGEDSLEKLVKTHSLGRDVKSLKKESFDDFVEDRLDVLRQNIEKVTAKKISQSDRVYEKK